MAIYLIKVTFIINSNRLLKDVSFAFDPKLLHTLELLFQFIYFSLNIYNDY